MDKSIVGHIEPFELQGGDWVLYTERVEQFFIANGIEDNKKKVATLLIVIGDKAYSLLRNLLAPTKPAEKTYGELVDVMKRHLKPKPPVIAERFKFHRRNQREGETVAQYLAVLRELTENCEFGDKLDETLRDRLVCGLKKAKRFRGNS